jgi:hypothetical protein
VEDEKDTDVMEGVEELKGGKEDYDGDVNTYTLTAGQPTAHFLLPRLCSHFPLLCTHAQLKCSACVLILFAISTLFLKCSSSFIHLSLRYLSLTCILFLPLCSHIVFNVRRDYHE